MKRFWIVLLSFALIMLYGSAVFGADAKFSGEYFLKGWYNKNHSLIDKNYSGASSVTNRGSSAFYTQRLRIGMDFQVAKGLTLFTRFDALERKWMAARKAIPAGNGNMSTDNEAENIQFDTAYVVFATPIGKFTVGSAADVHVTGVFGTPLSENGNYRPNNIIAWSNRFGKFYVSAQTKKSTDNFGEQDDGTPSPYTGIGTGTDNDSDTYQLVGIYGWKGGGIGGSLGYVRSRTANYPIGASNHVASRKTEIPYMSLWVKQKFGKIYIADEFGCVPFGDYIKFNTPIHPSYVAYYQDVKADMAMSNLFMAEVDLAPAKLGFMFVYSRGDDPNTKDKKEGGFRSALNIDRDFNPCLILWNEDYMTWMGGGTNNLKQTGTLKGNAGDNGISTYVQNVWLYQLYGSYRLSPKLDLDASFTYAYADEDPIKTGWVSDKYGSEFDLSLRYKIFDNLEYMISAAYLWTGDYFKGTDAAVKLSDNYMITHKLTLTF